MLQNSYDWPTLIIAIIAVIISLISIWLQIRKKSKLSVRLFDFKLLNTEDNDALAILNLTYFIGNRGNVDSLLTNATLLRHNGTAETDFEVPRQVELPLVIKPHEVNLFVVKIKLKDYVMSNELNSNLTIRFDFLYATRGGVSCMHQINGIVENPKKISYYKIIRLDKTDLKSQTHRVAKFD
ncbi:MAG: hypothetical protein RL308_88 [Bacteroidota bacterium]|jgi:hypothetical protein